MTRILHFLHSSALWPSELNPLFLLLGSPLYCAVQWRERRSGLHVGVPDPGGEALTATGIAVRGRERDALSPTRQQPLKSFMENAFQSWACQDRAGVFFCKKFSRRPSPHPTPPHPPALTASCILKTIWTYILYSMYILYVGLQVFYTLWGLC